ncbi:MAG TPA: alpha-ketoacid dehydrogenase subunit beta, partial [Anaeromyxobacteraceae bacterium]|nr:alpha-ketoacid dehydrogenase subunit beta [Anaeromyxobacteraceae bacterium]
GTKYVPAALFERWAPHDPLLQHRTRLIERGEADEETLAALDAALAAEVEEAAEWALRQPEAVSTPEGEHADVYAPCPPSAAPGPEGAGPRRERRFIDALSEGLAAALDADERVLIMGQDVAEYGGVFKVTAGLVERFGRDRVRNTPIIESGALGCAMGLALEGFKPVVEMQYADFIACGFNQIVNNLATTHYRWGAPLNVTVRAPFGGGIGAGPFHSQSPEAWFCHVPGLKVVVPATPEDAKGLLRAAIEDPNPVLFFEHKLLYRAEKGLVPEDDYAVPLGRARLARSGTDVTVVTWGVGVRWALDEATRRAAEGGGSVEVVDLRTLVPWDRETVRASLAKTNRLVVLHEAARTGGFGAEVGAQLAEEAFGLLDAPPARVAGADLPIAFSKQIESEVYAAKARLGAALDKVLAF